MLIDLLRAPGNASDIVVGAVAARRQGRITGLLAALETADDEVAAALTAALARMQRADATAALLGAMASPNVGGAQGRRERAGGARRRTEALRRSGTPASTIPTPRCARFCAASLAR